MEKISREQFLARLQNSWQPLVSRFQQLSGPEQAAYLEKQGYATFSALLAHIIAWWQDGTQVVAQMRADPSLGLPDYDVDSFNARAVARFSPLNEAALIQLYEAQRQAMVALVTSLSDAELNRDPINTRLYYEIIMHWSEHELSPK